jgi:hypothetical protein
MNQNLVRTVIGAAGGAAMVFLWFYAQEKFFNEHDEPVIVENGSLIVDLNPRGNKDLLGGLWSYPQYQMFVRNNSDPVQRIRVFKKPPRTSSWTEFDCGGSQCLPPPEMSSKLLIDLTNGYAVSINWDKGEHSGLVLHSPLQRFEEASAQAAVNPKRIKSLVDSSGSQPSIKGIRFTANSREWEFTPEDGGDIRVQLCTSEPDSLKYCTYYDPNRP